MRGTEAHRNKIALDQETFRKKMAPALAFADKYNVPIWVGEFWTAKPPIRPTNRSG